MANNITGNDPRENRSEPRTLLDKYHTVQFTLNRAGPAYMFKLWDLSARGLCILVRRDSAVLKVLKVGDIMEMQFLAPGARVPTEQLRTEIRHITAKDEESPARGHSMVGLLILERQAAEA